MKKAICEYSLITLGSLLYAVSTVLFIFPIGLLLGGTDIVALIVKEFSNLQIGRALLIADVLIVIVGGALAGFPILLSSFSGLLVKTFGIDAVIAVIGKIRGDYQDY